MAQKLLASVSGGGSMQKIRTEELEGWLVLYVMFRRPVRAICAN